MGGNRDIVLDRTFIFHHIFRFYFSELLSKQDPMFIHILLFLCHKLYLESLIPALSHQWEPVSFQQTDLAPSHQLGPLLFRPFPVYPVPFSSFPPLGSHPVLLVGSPPHPARRALSLFAGRAVPSHTTRFRYLTCFLFVLKFFSITP